MRRLTVVAAVTATALNVALFAQTGLGSTGLGGVENAALELINAVLPGASGLRPGAAPTPSPDGARPVVVSGGS